MLISRDSTVRASGVTPSGDYDLSNGSGDFELFADNLLSDEAAAAHSMARQNSRPVLAGDTGDFAGASAEGAARAVVDAAVADAYASAQSDFDVVFRVDGKPTRVLLDCVLGASGDATAGVKLYDAVTLASAFADEAAGDSHVSRGEKVLEPGVYGMSVWAFVRGTPDDSSASYTVNLTVAAEAGPGPGPVPMPLPAGAWMGMGTFVVVLGAMLHARRRQLADVR